MPIYYNEASLQDECMRDLKAVAAVLKFAVQTVAAAAEDKAVRQPSKRLVTVCCLAVRALSGACPSGQSRRAAYTTAADAGPTSSVLLQLPTSQCRRGF